MQVYDLFAHFSVGEGQEAKSLLVVETNREAYDCENIGNDNDPKGFQIANLQIRTNTFFSLFVY